MTDSAPLAGIAGGKIVKPEPPEELVACELAAVDPEEEALLAEFEIRSAGIREVADWLPDWFLGKLVGIEGLRAAIKKQQVELLKACELAERALKRRWGAQFQALVESELARSPKKSISYGTGKAGFRMTRPKLKITNEQEALESCRKLCPDAIARAEYVKAGVALAALGPIIEKTGEEPEGFCYIAASNAFYPDCGAPALPSSPRKELSDENGNERS